MKRNTWIIIVVAVAMVAAGATDIAFAKKKKVDGKKLYREFCKPCHTEDSEYGEYQPLTLIQDQWDRFFDEKYEATHSDLEDPNHVNMPLSEIISEDVIEAIRKFTIKGAADSEHPMTCG